MANKIEDFEVAKSNVYKTDYLNAFYNSDKKFGQSLSVHITDIESLMKFSEYFEVGRKNKDGTKTYMRFKFPKELLIVDDSNRVQMMSEKEYPKLFMENDVKIIFTVSDYTMAGKSGKTLKMHQIQYKPKENKYLVSMFD